MVEESENEGTRERIRRVVRNVAGHAPDNDDENLRDIGVDSFMIVELTIALESEFSISVPDDQLQWSSMETVSRISEIVARCTAAGESAGLER